MSLAPVRYMQLQTELDRMLKVMIESYNPQKIILFGSLAEGSVHEFSDIDLVVIKDTKKTFYERLEEIVEVVQPQLATEIIVYTPEEADRLKDFVLS